jgi:hypothetical protein
MSMNNFLKQLVTGDDVKDFTHASNTFVDGGMRLHPKVGFLYHVFIDRNPNVFSGSADENIELGMMAKRVQLPSFNVAVKDYNAYNRVNLVQSKIKYDPVTITFHDDMANVVNTFWKGYYEYYYQDSKYPESQYAYKHKYAPRLSSNWGFRGETGQEPYLSSIRIYQLYQKRFNEFTLINPMITSWKHGEQDYGSSTPVENQLSINFETVRYAEGYITGESVKGFGDIHYDKSPSPLTPLGGGTNSILGPGGLLNTVDEITGDFASGNILGGIVKTALGLQNFKDANLGSIIKEEGASIAKSLLRNPGSKIQVPGGNKRAP